MEEKLDKLIEIVGTIQIIVGIVQTKDLVLAIKNLRKKQKECRVADNGERKFLK